MEMLSLALFCLGLLVCLLFDLSILYALAGGLVLFLLYGRCKGFSWKELGQMALSGVKTVKNILITFVLIGMLTALWRAAGVVPVIVCYTTWLIQPAIFLVMAFLLNCLVSVLTGTAFGTAATMGVICATIGTTMGVNTVLVGGAVLSGVFFGDRCSPVSTSALLVSELTQTNIFQNIKSMLRTAAVPFVLTCLLYTGIGLFMHSGGELPDLYALFGREFRLHWIGLLPAVVILVLSLMQVKVKLAMGLSILTCLPICLFFQHIPPLDLPMLLLTGYEAADPEVAALLNGGGITSMLRVGAIVCLSSSYSGIFQKTGLLNGIQRVIGAIAQKSTAYTAILATSVVSGMVACNQTLAIMLTHQLCAPVEDDPQKLAIHLEDSAVVTAPLVPWSIAGAVPLASVGAPASSVLFSFFLILLPLWRLVSSLGMGRGKAAPQRSEISP